MPTANQIYKALDACAPFALQMDFDNAGFLVGDGSAAVHRILVALDITEDVVREAAQWGAQLIVSHHPVIFHPIKAIRREEPVGRLLMMLIEHQIGAICCHTNLDAVQEGVNDVLARAVGLTELGQLRQTGTDERGAPYGIGRVGRLKGGPLPLRDYLLQVKEALHPNGLRFCDAGRPVSRVAVGGGACGDMLKDAVAAGCDTFLTSDVSYHVFLDARGWKINLIDAGHFPTEDVICTPLADFLDRSFADLEVRKSGCHREVISYA